LNQGIPSVTPNVLGDAGFGLPQFFEDPRKPVSQAYKVHHDKVYSIQPSTAVTNPDMVNTIVNGS
jgi:hypothetical protein